MKNRRKVSHLCINPVCFSDFSLLFLFVFLVRIVLYLLLRSWTSRVSLSRKENDDINWGLLFGTVIITRIRLFSGTDVSNSWYRSYSFSLCVLRLDQRLRQYSHCQWQMNHHWWSMMILTHSMNVIKTWRICFCWKFNCNEQKSSLNDLQESSKTRKAVSMYMKWIGHVILGNHLIFKREDDGFCLASSTFKEWRCFVVNKIFPFIVVIARAPVK